MLDIENTKTNQPDCYGAIFLSPLDAKCESRNGILQMTLNKFPDGSVSMGNLHQINDRLIWNVNISDDCEFMVDAAFGSIQAQDDAGFALTAGDSKLIGRTWLTEHFSKPERRRIGNLKISKGLNRLELRVTDFGNISFSNVFGLWLIPTD